MQKMTESELEDLVASLIHIEGYTDARSIYNLLRQEYPGEFDQNKVLQVIHKVLKEESGN